MPSPLRAVPKDRAPAPSLKATARRTATGATTRRGGQRRKDVPGVVYLLHFCEPYRHARHYVGFTESDVLARIDAHERGEGARLMQVIAEAGIGFMVARTWNGTRALERKKKNRGATRICPVCRGERPRIDHRDRSAA